MNSTHKALTYGSKLREQQQMVMQVFLANVSRYTKILKLLVLAGIQR